VIVPVMPALACAKAFRGANDINDTIVNAIANATQGTGIDERRLGLSRNVTLHLTGSPSCCSSTLTATSLNSQGVDVVQLVFRFGCGIDTIWAGNDSIAAKCTSCAIQLSRIFLLELAGFLRFYVKT
jgi:hypothetical protein